MIKRFTIALKVFFGIYGVTRWKDGLFQFREPDDKKFYSFDRKLKKRYNERD